MSILKTEHLIKQYGKEPNIVRALDDVSISMGEGDGGNVSVNASLVFFEYQ